jgi:uncharacterized protein YnzC (UPF0291/DUF896 family)
LVEFLQEIKAVASINRGNDTIMNIEFIEQKINEINKELEREVMSVLMDESLDKKQTNLHMKPLTSTKQILTNALDSIKMVDKLGRGALEE